MKDPISGSVLGSALWDFHSAFAPWVISREVNVPRKQKHHQLGWSRSLLPH